MNTDSDVDLFDEALEGRLGEDQQRIAREGVKLIATLIRKNTDYGSSAWEPPILSPGLPVSSAILVRMSDKVKRIASLSNGDTAMVAESLEDTITDLAGYAILWLARPQPQEHADGV